ncbi:MAG: cytochrome c-type biogenesis protein [Myxococcota bacterium]
MSGARPVLVALAALVLLAPAALAQSDRGETVAPDDALTLSPDVEATVGKPLGPPVGPAQLEEATHELASRIRCPVCQGHSISDSPSETARNMLALVRAMVAAGYIEDQVFVYFETRYGEFIRLLPRAEGFNLLVWAIPLGALLIGVIVVGVFFRRSRATVRAKAAGAAGTAGAVAAKSADGSSEKAAPSELDPWLEQIRRDVERDDS